MSRRLVEAVYAASLLLFPATFRRRHREAMLECLRDRLDDPRYRGTGRLRLVALLVEDTTRSVQRERARAGYGAAWAGWRDDARFAVRLLHRDRSTTAVATLALALGTGLSTIAFAVVYGTVLRGLPFEDANALVHFERANRSEGRDSMAVTPHDFVAWRAGQEAFVDLAAYVEALFLITGEDGFAREHWGLAISPHAFALLGVEPVLGRVFRADEGGADGNEVVLIGHELWRQEFHGDPDVVGSTIDVNGAPTTVVGVMPPGFGFPLVEQLWRPLHIDLAEHDRGGGRLDVFGRLREDVTLEQARTNIEAVAAALAADFPDTNAGIEPRLRSFVEEYVGDEFTTRVWTMLFAAVLVLALSCLNITSLLVARANARAGEVAVRVALGAGRLRIARQLLVETIALTSVGGLLGLAVAAAGLRLVARYWAGTSIFQLPHGPDAPSWWAFQLDGAVVAFCLVATLLAAVISGMAPLWHVRRADVHSIIKTQRADQTGVSRRWGALVVIGEMALCTALLICAGLVVRSYGNLGRVTDDLDLSGLYAGRVSLPAATVFDGSSGAVPTQYRYDNLEARLQFWDQLRLELESLEDVGAYALVSTLPATGAHRTSFTLPGSDPEESSPSARYAVVDPAFFELLGVAAVQGRLFGSDDQDLVAVVNAPFAERYFPDGALNQRLRLGRAESESQWLRVVGVVPDLRMNGVGGREPEGLYLPHAQVAYNGAPMSMSFTRVILEARGSADEVERTLREVVLGLDARAPVSTVESLRGVTQSGTERFRVHGSFYLLLGGVAVLLAGIGLYGVLAQSVVRRRAEIGTRIALGADTTAVVRLVVRQAMGQVMVGALAGLLVAAWLQPQLEQILYGVESWDPLALIAPIGMLVGMAAIASLVPARRAAGVDPVEAMRAQ